MVILEILKNLKISENFEFFWKFWKKIENFGKKFPKFEANFDGERGIWNKNSIFCQTFE